MSGVIIFVCGFVKKLATRILLNTTKPGIVAKSIWGPDNSVRALAGGVHTNNVARHNEAHIGRQFFFLFVGMLLLANSVSASGLLNTREKDVRFYFEDLKILPLEFLREKYEMKEIKSFFEKVVEKYTSDIIK